MPGDAERIAQALSREEGLLLQTIEEQSYLLRLGLIEMTERGFPLPTLLGREVVAILRETSAEKDQ